MRTLIIASLLLGSGVVAFAQGAPSGHGSTSTSGGKDANGDQGRDKMPESNSSVKPQPGKVNIPDPTNKSE